MPMSTVLKDKINLNLEHAMKPYRRSTGTAVSFVCRDGCTVFVQVQLYCLCTGTAVPFVCRDKCTVCV
jgi:hypothetical protein